MTRRILVTGASGFVARALFDARRVDDHYVAASREPVTVEGVEWVRSPDLSPLADWRPLLQGVDSVVHLAARVHLGAEGDPSAYMVENAAGTLKLAGDAIESGVRSFVFLSSAKVLGDESGAVALTEFDPSRPGDDYARSKLAAEQGLNELSAKLRTTILRSPLVYGPGVKANFLALVSAVARGLPLPLASVRNRRSLVGVDNLASAVLACLQLPAAAGRIFNVTDGAPLSTPALVQAIATAIGKPSRLFPFPVNLLEACGAAIGRAETIKRLTRSLELDDSAIRRELGWRPVRTLEEGLADTAKWYASNYAGSS